MSLLWVAVCIVLVHTSCEAETVDDDEKFLYFAYGCNLLKKRILVHNPTARFYSTAKLPGYRLDFNVYVASWNGAVATIVEDTYSHVWGALWTIELNDMNNLDTQEGVHIGSFNAKNVSVLTPEGKILEARTYIETVDPPKVPTEEIPPERQPSDTYKQVLIYGAFESALRMDYIKYLFTFPSNGKLAMWSTRQELGHPFNATFFY